MLSFFGTSKNRNRKSKRSLQYNNLEARQLLAVVTSFDVGSGELAIELTDNNDTAVVDVSGGQVTVNGNNVAAQVAVNSFDVDGDATKASQAVAFGGTWFGVNSVQTISVDDVNTATFNGSFRIEGDLNVVLVGADGGVGDASTGRLIVDGTTDIDARNNGIVLNNATNDFRGPVNITTGGDFNSVRLADANDIEFARAITTGGLEVNAGGDITDVAGAVIEVGHDGDFTAANVTLGDNASDTTNFFRTIFNTTGHVELHEDSNVIFAGSSQMDSAYIESAGGIYDGRTTNVNVTGLAQLHGDARVRLGEHGADTFNAGQVEIQTNGHVHLWEDSGTRIVGENFARSMDIRSLGDLTDADDATINVQFSTGFEADNVYIGDTATDEFNSGTFYFWSLGDMYVTEDSSMHIFDSKNYANRAELVADGMITDADDAYITIERLARFQADDVTIGDTTTDQFNAGSISYDVSGRFFVSENSNTNVAGNNQSATAVVNSSGNLTNSEETTIATSGSHAFFGQNVILGNQNLDNLNFGTLTVNTPSGGQATVFENGATIFAGNSSVGTLRMISEGSITDGGEATLNVEGVATLNATAVALGDTDLDEFNASAVNVNSTGNVMISEDSDTFFTGNNTANSLMVEADGNITDGEEATINVQFLLDVTADFINLGTELSDLLSFSSLTANSSGNVTMDVDKSFTLTGSSTANRLILQSTGNILDAVDASIVAQESAFFTGNDIVLGDSTDDCLDVPVGNLGVDASGLNEVTLGC